MTGATTLQKISTELKSLGGLIRELGYDIYNFPEPFNCEADKWHFNHPYFDPAKLNIVANVENSPKLYFNSPSV
jgi:hypothetical protein